MAKSSRAGQSQSRGIPEGSRPAPRPEHEAVAAAPSTGSETGQTERKSLWLIGLIAALAAVALVTWFVQYLYPIMDGDTWHQMAYGRYMLENRSLTIEHTAFCWTQTSGDFIYCAWIAEIILHLIYKVGGTPLLHIFRYLCQVPFLLALILYARSRGVLYQPLTWLFIVLGILMAVNSGYEKPNMSSHVFMTFTVCLWLYLKHAKSRSPYVCYLFPAAMLLWANTHGGFIFGAIFLFLMAMGEEINAVFSPTAAFPLPVRKHLFVALFLSAATVLLTPYGLEYPSYLVKDLLSKEYSDITSAIREYDSIFAPHQQGFHFVDFLKMTSLLLAGLLATQVVARFAKPGNGAGRPEWSNPVKVTWAVLLLNVLLGGLLLQYVLTPENGNRAFAGLGLLFLALAAGQIVIGLARTRRESGQTQWDALLQIDWAILLVNLGIGALYTRYLRTTFFWAPVFAFSAIHLLSCVPRRVWAGSRAWTAGMSAAVALTCFVLGGRLIYERMTKPMWAAWPGFGISYLHPVDEAEFIRQNLGQYKVGNDYNVGGYLMWRLSPQIPTFIDGRMYPFRPWWNLYRAFETGARVQEFISEERFKADIWCINYYHPKTITWFVNSPDWKTVFYDISSAIFVRKDVELPPSLPKRGTRIQDIRNMNQGLLALQFAINIRDWEGADTILASLKRSSRRGEDKKSVEGAELFLAGIKAYYARDYVRAAELLETSWKKKVIYNMALLVGCYQHVAVEKWRTNEEVEALKYARKGLAAMPDELISLYNAGVAEWYLAATKGVTVPEEPESPEAGTAAANPEESLLARCAAWLRKRKESPTTEGKQPTEAAKTGPKWEQRLKAFVTKSVDSREIPAKAREVAQSILQRTCTERPPLITPQKPPLAETLRLRPDYSGGD